MSSPTKIILAIDPGPEKSAWVLMNGMSVMSFLFEPNDSVLRMIEFRREVYVGSHVAFLVIEDMVNYGMPAGPPVRETLIWMGQFKHANGGQMERITNAAIRSQICHSMKAKDANIRAALIERYGGQETAIGRKPKNKKDKSRPGPLNGLRQKEHHWSALAVGVAWLELQEQKHASP